MLTSLYLVVLVPGYEDNFGFYTSACLQHSPNSAFGDQEAYIVASLNTWKYGRSRGSPRRVLRQSDRCRALWCACCQSDQCYTRGVLACWYNDHNDIAVLQLIRKLKCE